MKVSNLSVRKSCFKIHNTIERQESGITSMGKAYLFSCQKEVIWRIK